MRYRTLLVIPVTSLALAGCGAAGRSSTREGAAVFAKSCSGCHSLIGNESRRKQGGDLVGYRLSRKQLIEFTSEMPTRRPLTSLQLNRVVDYVLEVQQRRSAQ